MRTDARRQGYARHRRTPARELTIAGCSRPKDQELACSSADSDSESDSDSDEPPVNDSAVADSPLASPFHETPKPLRLPFSVSFTPSGDSVTMYGLPSISISRFSSLSSLVAISPSLECVEEGFYRTQAKGRYESGVIVLEHRQLAG